MTIDCFGETVCCTHEKDKSKVFHLYECRRALSSFDSMKKSFCIVCSRTFLISYAESKSAFVGCILTYKSFRISYTCRSTFFNFYFQPYMQYVEMIYFMIWISKFGLSFELKSEEYKNIFPGHCSQNSEEQYTNK